jgi:hypothetical protein
MRIGLGGESTAWAQLSGLLIEGCLLIESCLLILDGLRIGGRSCAHTRLSMFTAPLWSLATPARRARAVSTACC